MTRRRILCLVFISLLAPVARGAAEPDAEALNGTWLPVTAELAGEPRPQQILDRMKLVVKDDKYTVDVAGKSDEGTITRDPSKSPKTMDIKGTKGPNAGKTLLVIYELKKDELRVCYDLSGKSRPKEFATKGDSLLFLVKYRRAKP